MTRREIEAEARRIGARRKRHSNEGDAIQEEVTKVVAEARGVVPMEHLADLLGMHRSSIYELYIGGSSDDSNKGTGDDGARQGTASSDGTSRAKAKDRDGTSVPS